MPAPKGWEQPLMVQFIDDLESAERIAALMKKSHPDILNIIVTYKTLQIIEGQYLKAYSKDWENYLSGIRFWHAKDPPDREGSFCLTRDFYPQLSKSP